MVKGTDVVKFDVTEAAIAKMENLYMSLTVKDVDDQEGFKQVHDARMVVVKHRTSTEKRRKELKADALAYGRKVDGAAKEIFSKLEPIESHLAQQEKIVTDEKNRIKEAEEKAFQDKIDKRISLLSGYNFPAPYQEIALMSDDEFDENLEAARKRWEAEQARIAEEKRIEQERQDKIEAEQKAEAERLEKIRIEQDKINAELAAKQAEIDAKERKLKEEQERIERAEFEKKAAEQARIKAEKDAAEKVEREKKEAEERKVAEEKEAARIEALKPDMEKALLWLEEAGLTPEFPTLSNKPIASILESAQTEIEILLDNYSNEIKGI